jgi:hypothetical protein
MIPALDWKDGLQLTVGEERDPEGKPFCHVVGPPGLQFEAARLFAAAPKLLAALQTIRPNERVSLSQWNQIKAAIAKACPPTGWSAIEAGEGE